MTREQLEELMDEYYGTEESDFEGGVVEDNYALADWSRYVVPDLFDAINILLDKLAKMEAK